LSLVAWRIVQRRFAKEAFSGEGARRYGGRWNSPGIAIVFTAQSLALAALEILVHVDSEKLLAKYLAIPVTIEENLVIHLDASEELNLPRNWHAQPASMATRHLGDKWAREGNSAVLRVPSAVIPSESNFLLNPAHADFNKLIVGKPATFEFDPRFTKKS
jgi:RES domain-containing protein